MEQSGGSSVVQNNAEQHRVRRISDPRQQINDKVKVYRKVII